MQRSLRTLPALVLTLLIGLMFSSEVFAQANIVILNGDAAGVGFNDTTPAAPVGGNNGTTIGEQRLIAVQAAANIWGATLSSSPTITIRATWQSFNGCTTSGGTLASAGNNGNIWRDFSGSVPGHFYGNALASALQGIDTNGAAHEINARFNISLGTPGCLDNLHWYYGLDANEGPTGVDLVTVALHEFAHGLGFQTFTNSDTGQQVGSQAGGFFPSIYDRFLFDNSTNKTWPQMTDAERAASARNDGNLVWNGPQVTADSGLLTFGKDAQGHPRMFAPSTFESGSSVSHWDDDASPNQLMEHLISRFLSHSVSPPQDLTLSLLKDIGWPTGPPPPPPPAPANDNFANAQIINGCSGTVNGTNLGATQEAGEPSHAPDDQSSGSPNHTVWYRWQAPASTSVTIDTVGNTNFDTIVAVYTSFSAAGRVTFNDDIDPGIIRTSRLTFNAVAGTTYWIAVDGWGGETGNFQLNWNQSNCTVVGPTIFVEQGTNVLAALDSVTQVKGPFTVLTPHNFSLDGRRRIIFFTTDLGLPAGNTTGLSVEVNPGAIPLPVENAGPFTAIGGSYVIVQLPNLSPNTYTVTVRFNGANSTNSPTITIVP